MFLVGRVGYYETNKICFIIFGATENLLWILQVLVSSKCAVWVYSGQNEVYWRSDRQDSRLDRQKYSQTTPI